MQSEAKTKYVGRCIYCLSTETLTDEHIVPLNIGGDRVLAGASCESCQQIIHPIETACLKEISNLRYRRGIGKRRRKSRPTKLRTWVLTNWDGEEEVPPPGKNPAHKWEQIELPYSQHPTFMGLPVFKFPGAFRGISAPQSMKDHMVHQWFHIEPFDRNETRPMWTEHGIDNILWARMIAKIAQGFAVWEFGLDNFESFLPEIILGQNLAETFHLIGGDPAKSHADEEHLSLKIFRGNPGCGPDHIFSSIRLFADLGAPTYYALVGKYSKIDHGVA